MSTTFDPNSAASHGGIFGLPYTEEESALVYLPVPWEATTSYGAGTSGGPAAILTASFQVDLFDLDVERPYEPGLFMRPEPEQVRAWNTEAKEKAQRIIDADGETGGDPALEQALADVNALSHQVNGLVRMQTEEILAAGRIPGIVGGDHSVPFGALQAMAARVPSFGVLHVDAHSDTRNAYQGFEHSHASIMFNVLERIPQVEKLVQVGIRDFCEEENDYCLSQGERVKVFFDAHLARAKYAGETWDALCKRIVAALPSQVWISFDIDGLDPRFCPNTGTPVPGGLDFNEAVHLIGEVVRSGRKVLGFDLNEVAPDPQGADEWDANVGARMLYKLTAWTLASQGKRRLR